MKKFQIIFASLAILMTCLSGCSDKESEPSSNGTKTANFVDLGLQSGTKWKSTNEDGYYNYQEAIDAFGTKLPTKEQFDELLTDCTWEWKESKYKITGPNGQSIFLPAAGWRWEGEVWQVGELGNYMTSTLYNSDWVWFLYFKGSVLKYMKYDPKNYGRTVRLVSK